MKRLALMAVAFLVESGCEAGPAAPTTNASLQAPSVTTEVVALGVEGICAAITPARREQFGIHRVEWLASDVGVPFPHCKILSSVATSGAEFDGYKLTGFNQNIPTAAVSRIACKPTSRVAHAITLPGGSVDLTGVFGANAFRGFGGPAGGCIAVTMIAYPAGAILDRIDAHDALYLPPNGGRGILLGLHAAMQNSTAMMRTLFFDTLEVAEDARQNICVGISSGSHTGLLLMDDWQGLPCDGVVESVGGDGYFPLIELIRSVCVGDRTHPLLGTPVSCDSRDLANDIGLFDKGFREDVLSILATQGDDAAWALLGSYDITARSPAVQNVAERLTPTGALRRPTIVIHGTLDGGFSTFQSLKYARRVLGAQRQDLMRFYVVGGLDHDQTVNFTTAAAARLLLKWMAGEEPGDLVFTAPGRGTITVTNSKDAGFEHDPCGYYDFTAGSTACRDSGLFPEP